MIYRREDGHLFRRTFLGYRTEAQALAVAKEAWREGSAVKVEQGRCRWHVWRSV